MPNEPVTIDREKVANILGHIGGKDAWHEDLPHWVTAFLDREGEFGVLPEKRARALALLLGVPIADIMPRGSLLSEVTYDASPRANVSRVADDTPFDGSDTCA